MLQSVIEVRSYKLHNVEDQLGRMMVTFLIDYFATMDSTNQRRWIEYILRYKSLLLTVPGGRVGSRTRKGRLNLTAC